VVPQARTAAASLFRYYAQVKDRCNGKRAALSEARKILRQACHILTELGSYQGQGPDSATPQTRAPMTAQAPHRTLAVTGGCR